MEMRQCQVGGHFYDASLYAECPYCKNNEMSANITNYGVPMPVYGGGDNNHTQAINYGVNTNYTEDSKTIAVIKNEIGIDPVVGWLVCIQGNEKGKDYRLHSDNNYIGRGEKMDVSIGGDGTISRDNHAIVSYDGKEKIFYLSPGEGRSILRLNDKAIFATAPIKEKDVIEIGETKLLFIPLCTERFEWN